jgi:hypothetical protein
MVSSWSLQVSSGLCRFLMVSAGFSWFLPVSAGLSWSLLVSHAFTSGNNCNHWAPAVHGLTTGKSAAQLNSLSSCHCYHSYELGSSRPGLNFFHNTNI